MWEAGQLERGLNARYAAANHHRRTIVAEICPY
jgi:hypothetical protein